MAVRPPAMAVPVFAAVGRGAWEAVQELRGEPRVRLVTSPRHAAVLLVAGAVPDDQVEALDRLHDQVPHPRATVAWTGASGPRPAAARVVTGPAPALVEAIVAVAARLNRDPSTTEPDRRPDRDPHPWRGVGPFGQGGEGMMGGTPYGRPMAMTAEGDRDGLALDALELRLGPFLDALPVAGMTLDVVLHGDVVQHAGLGLPRPDAPVPGPPPGPAADDPATAAVRRGLCRLAHGLHLQGLDAAATRAAALAARVATGEPVPPAAARSLARAVHRSGVRRALRGVGRLDGQGDAATRWRDLMAWLEAALAAAPEPSPDRHPWSPAPASAVEGALVGATLSDALATLASVELAGATVGGARG